MFRFLSISLFFLVSSIGISQDSTAVHFIFPSADVFEIRVDEVHIYDKKDFFLAEGHHKIEIWTEGLTLRTDSIFVNPDSYNLFQYRSTPVLPEIVKYKKEKTQYLVGRSIVFGLFIPTGIASYAAINRYNEAKLIYSEISSLSNFYSSSLDLTFLAKADQDFELLTKQYEEKRTGYRRLVIASSSMLLCNAGLTYFFYKFFKKPIRHPKKSPFRENGVKLSIYPTTYGMGINLKL